ncbi:MAG TPA: hypothetical protein VHE30_29970 [Polyangiaceae bacterium]|nr:hypothetical protein [Polyangiaceae bacterium]
MSRFSFALPLLVVSFAVPACTEAFHGAASSGEHPSVDGGTGGSRSGGSGGANGGASGSGSGGASGHAGGANESGGAHGGTTDSGSPVVHSDASAPPVDSGVTVEPAETGSPPPPVPTDGLVLWLRADLGVTTTSGSKVSIWTDQSPAHQDGIQTASNLSPILVADGISGKPSLSFDGVDDYIRLPSGFSDFQNGVSVFAVVDVPAETTNCSAIVEFSNGSEIDDVSFGFWQQKLQYEVVDGYVNDGTYDPDVPALVGVVHRTSGDLQVRRNGNSEGEAQFALPGVVDRTEANVGKTLYAGCGLFGGLLGELLVYNRALGDRELLDLEAALRARWSCCAN